MRLNKETLKQVLEVAAEKGEAGFEEQDILPIFHNNEYDLLRFIRDRAFKKSSKMQDAKFGICHHILLI